MISHQNRYLNHSLNHFISFMHIIIANAIYAIIAQRSIKSENIASVILITPKFFKKDFYSL